MDAGRVTAVGQATGDIGTNLATCMDRTAGDCVGTARAFPAWATSQATLDLHAAHTENLNDHVTVIRTTGSGMQASAELGVAADNRSAGYAAAVIPGAL